MGPIGHIRAAVAQTVIKGNDGNIATVGKHLAIEDGSRSLDAGGRKIGHQCQTVIRSHACGQSAHRVNAGGVGSRFIESDAREGLVG